MQNAGTWSLVCYMGDGTTGSVSVVQSDNAEISVKTVPQGALSGKEGLYKPLFLGISNNSVVSMDPVSKQISNSAELAADAFAAYAYREPDSERIWFMNDGDKKTGNDEINCGDNGSTVTIISSADPAQVIKTICVGRGHHVTTAPSASAPNVPLRAFVSNLKDGSISVVGNDPSDAATYLQVITTISLRDAARDPGDTEIPNDAFPHGMEYSAATGKIYCLNNGYGTIAVIDPLSNTVEQSIEMEVSSNLLLSRDGKFVIGKGADRKADPEHVVGRLTVVDMVSGAIEKVIDIPDLYPSTYRFNADGSKLYVTSAATGKDVQRSNLKKASLFIYDASALPELALIKEVEVGTSDCGRRPIAFLEEQGQEPSVFVPNPTDGTLSIIDGSSDTVVHTIKIADQAASDFAFSFWGEGIYGA
ncbi:MAG: hypothetical protein GXP10_11065 [Gammaproteobacteria bacterium]|nr:hypothetical protein [Gammaproteobacteria bacterium]